MIKLDKYSIQGIVIAIILLFFVTFLGFREANIRGFDNLILEESLTCISQVCIDKDGLQECDTLPVPQLAKLQVMKDEYKGKEVRILNIKLLDKKCEE